MSMSIGLLSVMGVREGVLRLDAVRCAGREPINRTLSEESLSTVAVATAGLLFGGTLLAEEPDLVRLMELVRVLFREPGEGCGGGAKVCGWNV